MPWIKVKNALLGVLRSLKGRFWRKLNYSSVTATLALLIALLTPGLTFYNTIVAHRSILLTVATQRPGMQNRPFMPNETYDLSPIIANVGNHTEIIPCVSIVSIPSSPVNSRYQGASAGPYILKAGDAITVPIKLSFDVIRLIGNGNEKDVYVRVVILSPQNTIIAVDIPTSHIIFSQTAEEINYTEEQSAKYNDLIDIFTVARSNFSPSCQEGVQALLQITVRHRRGSLPRQKHQ